MPGDVYYEIFCDLSIDTILAFQRTNQSNNQLVLEYKKKDVYIKNQNQLKTQLLTKALQDYCVDRVKLLLDAGADANATHTHLNGSVDSMLAMAINRRFTEGESLLRQFGAVEIE